VREKKRGGKKEKKKTNAPEPRIEFGRFLPPARRRADTENEKDCREASLGPSGSVARRWRSRSTAFVGREGGGKEEGGNGQGGRPRDQRSYLRVRRRRGRGGKKRNLAQQNPRTHIVADRKKGGKKGKRGGKSYVPRRRRPPTMPAGKLGFVAGAGKGEGKKKKVEGWPGRWAWNSRPPSQVGEIVNEGKGGGGTKKAKPVGGRARGKGPGPERQRGGKKGKKKNLPVIGHPEQVQGRRSVCGRTDGEDTREKRKSRRCGRRPDGSPRVVGAGEEGEKKREKKKKKRVRRNNGPHREASPLPAASRWRPEEKKGGGGGKGGGTGAPVGGVC